VLSTLDRDGFVIIPARHAVDLRDAYDAAVAAAACFDALWLDELVLAAAAHLFTRPFKLGTFHARAVRPGGKAQDLHVDCAHDAEGVTLVGFIWMIDAFTADNGATRFVPRGAPASEPVLATGSAGSLVIYDGATLHGYSANRSAGLRRSLQGTYILRTMAQWVPFATRIAPDGQSAQRRYLLDLG
jgi:ectoine hydroxylase-related dioxygenase (phytanoyl-CoA dioxygenase family)